MRAKFLLFTLSFLPFLVACNRTDDVGGIFIGKDWKLTAIWDEKDPKVVNIWADDEQKAASIKLLAGASNFTASFNGTEDKNTISGEFSGKGASSGFEGNWSADGKNNRFSTSQFKQAGAESDILAKVFIEGLKSATRYSGDENNLYLYFNYGNKTIRLAFSVKKN